MGRYQRGNNHSGYLLQVPSVRCTSRYGVELSRQSSFTDAAVNLISKSAQCTKGEGADCLIKALFKHHQNVDLGRKRRKFCFAI
jgi:hypothetical protein